MGDFNARTGSEEDLIISDDTSHVPLSDNQYNVFPLRILNWFEIHMSNNSLPLVSICESWLDLLPTAVSITYWLSLSGTWEVSDIIKSVYFKPIKNP
jgi:hypothetical protein